MGDRPTNIDNTKGMGRRYAHETPIDRGTTKDSRERAKHNTSLHANEELRQAMIKKDVEIKKTHTELMKAKAYLMEYLMREEELVREAEQAKDEVENMWNARGKYTEEINSLTRR